MTDGLMGDVEAGAFVAAVKARSPIKVPGVVTITADRISVTHFWFDGAGKDRVEGDREALLWARTRIDDELRNLLETP